MGNTIKRVYFIFYFLPGKIKSLIFAYILNVENGG